VHTERPETENKGREVNTFFFFCRRSGLTLIDRTCRRRGSDPGPAAGRFGRGGRRRLVVVHEKLELGLELLVVGDGLELVVDVGRLPFAAGGGGGPALGRRPERGDRERPVHPRGDELGEDRSPAHVVSLRFLAWNWKEEAWRATEEWKSRAGKL